MKKTYLRLMLLFVAALSAGCHGGHHHHHDHDEHSHHHGELITLYSNNFELYAECGEAVVGEPLTITTHITRLSDFKPLDSGEVRLSFTVGETTEEASIAVPDKKGIYSFSVTPRSAGTAIVRWSLPDDSWLQYDQLVVFASDEEFHAHHSDEPNKPNSVNFTKEQSWLTDFATEVIVPSPVGSVITTSGEVLPSQGDEREVAAKASGVVVFAAKNLVEGAEVKAGQRLFSIESSAMANDNMTVRYHEAKADYEAAKSTYERKQSLAADRIVAQSEVERAKVEYERAKAVYDNLKGNFSQSGAVVSSPITGYITAIHVSNGSFVEAGQAVATVSKSRDLFLRAQVPPRYFSDLHNIAGANIVMPDGEVKKLKDMNGELVNYGKAVDRDNPLIPVTFRISNQGGLLPGTFVKLHILTRGSSDALAVPNTGIVEEMGNHFVFVQVNPELFEKRLVKTDLNDGFQTVITEGLSAGERVVTKGAVMVKLAQGAGALDPHAGHVH